MNTDRNCLVMESMQTKVPIRVVSAYKTVFVVAHHTLRADLMAREIKVIYERENQKMVGPDSERVAKKAEQD